jgi:hypothetical protein
MRKTSMKSISRNNKKSKKNIKKNSKNNIKHYSRKNKINNMIGGDPKWNNTCGICLVNFKWTDDKWIEKFGKKPEDFNSVEYNGSKKNSNKNEDAEPLVISKISKLPCGHIVHTSCINDMLKHSTIRKCPSCTITFREEEVLPVGEYEYDKDYFTELFKSNETFDLNEFLHKEIKLKRHDYNDIEESIKYNAIIESISEALIAIKNNDEKNFKIKRMIISSLSSSLEDKILTKLVSGLSNILKENFKNFNVFKFNNISNLKLNHVILLAKGLEENKTLKELEISFNNINDASAVFLGKALEINNTIKSIDMRYNRNHIGKKGAEALVSGIKANTSLTRFLMDGSSNGSSIGIDVVKKFIEVISDKMKLYELSKLSKFPTQFLRMTLDFRKPYVKEEIKEIERLLRDNDLIIGFGIEG